MRRTVTRTNHQEPQMLPHTLYPALIQARQAELALVAERSNVRPESRPKRRLFRGRELRRPRFQPRTVG
jgi:hypothetical protein